MRTVIYLIQYFLEYKIFFFILNVGQEIVNYYAFCVKNTMKET